MKITRFYCNKLLIIFLAIIDAEKRRNLESIGILKAITYLMYVYAQCLKSSTYYETCFCWFHVNLIKIRKWRSIIYLCLIYRISYHMCNVFEKIPNTTKS